MKENKLCDKCPFFKMISRLDEFNLSEVIKKMERKYCKSYLCIRLTVPFNQ